MADAPVVHIGENSPEHVALKMTDKIFRDIEGKSYGDMKREEFLDTYVECLRAVKGIRASKEGPRVRTL